MNKTLLIIQREYLVRVRKPIFIIMTLLGPLLVALPYAFAFYFATKETDSRTIEVLDESGLLGNRLKDTKSLKFKALQGMDAKKAKDHLRQSEDYALLYIPRFDLEKPQGMEIFTKKNGSFEVETDIKNLLSQELENLRLEKAGIDKAILEKTKVKIDLRSQVLNEGGESSSNGLITYAISFGGALFLYVLLFVYGVQVMRGVLEEKTSRIMEVMVSSVKPFQLMMGKIVGIGLVGLTQFVAWVILASLLTTGVSYIFKDKVAQKAKTEQATQQAKIQNTPGFNQPGTPPTPAISGFEFLQSLNLPLLVGGFLFYFLGGYLLYSALFAAIGAAADAETDTQQFMFPVTIPIVVSFIAAQYVIREPDGAVAFWLSIFPLTSPIIMLVRLPFNPEWWEIGLSMVLLIGGFIGTTWLAARVYRVGILMYGKKVSYKELYKWLFYKA